MQVSHNAELHKGLRLFCSLFIPNTYEIVTKYVVHKFVEQNMTFQHCNMDSKSVRMEEELSPSVLG